MDARPLLLVLCVAGAVRAAGGVDVALLQGAALAARLQDNPYGGLNLLLQRKGLSEVIAVVGRRTGAVKDVVQDGDVVIQFSNDTTLRVSAEQPPAGGVLFTFTWEAPKTARLEDCVNLGTSHWYGGPEQKRQYWPIERLVLQDYSYVTKEADNCAIAEPYWLNSEGIFYYFDKEVPLFIDQNDLEKNAACFIAQIKPPYSSKRDKNDLIYAIGIFDDARKAHEYAVEKYLNKPSGIPDEKMITNPIWSTWARYKREIDHDTVLKFADEINKYGFPNSQFEIDDLWESCYGSQTVDTDKFPNMKATVDALKEKGFRVTLWTHPFINKGCEPWYSEAKSKGYLVSSEYNSVETSWWNDNETTTAYIDFTKAEARAWYTERLAALQNDTGIDSFNFDAGESDWAPQIPVLQGAVKHQPGVLTADYVRSAAKFGNMVTVRTGYRTQHLPVFVRMLDKDTYWTFENGLPTLVTTLLQLNMAGYPLVLPDVVGGSGYNDPPSKELFIRWLQATTFMPALHFSYVPWDFDNETIEISKRYVGLHAQYAAEIAAACGRAARGGAPVNPPVWWLDPRDAAAHDVWDEYLLGERILVAPVLERGSEQRDVYLPAGTWRRGGGAGSSGGSGDGGSRDGGSGGGEGSGDGGGEAIVGPAWLRGQRAPLAELLYYVRED